MFLAAIRKSIQNSFKQNDWLLLLLLVASLSLNVFLGWRLRRQTSDSVTRPPTAHKLSLNDHVPPLIVKDLTGKIETVRYSDSAEPTVLYVFSPSCKWCERNNPNVTAVANARIGSFRFVGLSLSDLDLANYVKAQNISFPVYYSPSREMIEQLGFSETPQLIVISPEGKVMRSWTGAFVTDVAQDVERFF
jgi:thioredoxin-related protein